MTAQEYFKYRAPNREKLKLYGFSERNGTLVYATTILDGQFRLTVTISERGEVVTELLDLLTEEPYTLHLVDEAVGAFVGSVREVYGAVLGEISARCFEKSVFREEQTQSLIEHVREAYGREPEYLWEKFPDCAIWRRGDNGKWFGIILTVPRKKLGISGEGSIEILDIRMASEELALLLDNKRYFPGWHMNKKHWLTVPLDGRLPIDEIFSLVEESYFLAKK